MDRIAWAAATLDAGIRGQGVLVVAILLLGSVAGPRSVRLQAGEPEPEAKAAQEREPPPAEEYAPCYAEDSDRIILKSGTALEGVLYDLTPTRVVIRGEAATLFVPREAVREIERVIPPAFESFFRKRVEKTKTLAEWRKLADFCKKKGAYPEYRSCMRAIVALEPEDAAAHAALGEVQLDDRWVPEEEVSQKLRQGYRIIDGKLVRTAPGAAERANRPVPKTVAEALKLAERCESEKDLEAALAAAQQALFLLPEDASIAQRVRRLASKVAYAKLREAKAALKKDDKNIAAALLTASYAIAPSAEAATALKGLDQVLHLGYWYPKSSLPALEKREADLEAAVRERLRLAPKEFRKLRIEHFRVFTDMPEGREWDDWLLPIFKVLESVFDKYQWTFQGEIDLDAARSGITVVFFRSRETYERYLRRSGIGFSFATAGFYASEQRSSFFFRDAGYGSIWEVLIHELTHQMNEEILHAANRVPWIDEGLAQYFEAGIVGPDYGLTIGRPQHERFMLVRSREVLDGEDYVPAARLFRARGVDDPALGCSVTQAYAQMWAWAYFFLHNEVRHRTAFLTCLRKERASQGFDDYVDPRDIYEVVLAEHGFKVGDDLDAQYKDFIKNLPMTQRK